MVLKAENQGQQPGSSHSIRGEAATPRRVKQERFNLKIIHIYGLLVHGAPPSDTPHRSLLLPGLQSHKPPGERG
ncbi:hypothetical protein CesoFtcFv8_013497 [Champsocephalus esox]|uniref:Uncharacterized protein n=1 Tax=Champsocephalus esox TaxID=159716 RepID=A0AAN8BRJ8_9TELE|nr:hypothetical protein CesoFtcFv8_013497 [Champsocephalus esox]